MSEMKTIKDSVKMNTTKYGKIINILVHSKRIVDGQDRQMNRPI